MTQLRSFESFFDDEPVRVPLAGVVEAMAESRAAMVYQALLRPMPDWSSAAHERVESIRWHQDTVTEQVVNVFAGQPDPDEISLPSSEEDRIEELEARDTRRSFAVNARVLALGPRAPVDSESAPDSTEANSKADSSTGSGTHDDDEYVENDVDVAGVVRDLVGVFGEVGQSVYEIEGSVKTGGSAGSLLEAIRGYEFHAPDYERLRTRLPFTKNWSQGIVADAREAPSFCLLGGDTLTSAGVRSVNPTPGERTGLFLPPPDVLATYLTEGFTIGRPVTNDGTPLENPVRVPVWLQTLQLAILGSTGSGKSVLVTNAILDNYRVTDGADIVVEPKGGSMVTDLLRAHFLEYGTLENVIYFDCSEVLPALSSFDIRGELEAGIPRAKATEDRTKHYVELLGQLMGQEQYGQAVRSPDVIEYLVKALFDPVHGSDAFTQRDLYATARRMAERQSAPSVSDPDLENSLEGVLNYRAQTFTDIMGGVQSRIEKITTHTHLARIFNHVGPPPANPDSERGSENASTDDPMDDAPAANEPDEQESGFDLAGHLNEDVLVVFDMGELTRTTRRALTLVILSNLWTALQRRTTRSQHTRTNTTPSPNASNPLVNLYLEEAGSLANSGLLQTMLAEAREFECSLTLSMQFPAQLEEQNVGASYELLNNVNSYIVGPVPHDPRLAERLATTDMTPQDVKNRLRALNRGQWLTSLHARFNEPPPRPFIVESLPLPLGHPESDYPLTPSEADDFQHALADTTKRTSNEYGLTINLPSTTDREETGAAHESLPHGTDGPLGSEGLRVDSALPYTLRMPETVEYDPGLHGLRCTRCDNRYDPTSAGMRRAIECCSTLADLDPADIPICELNLKLTHEELVNSEYSVPQLLFLQAVYNAMQLRFSRLEYDIVSDSMIRLKEYVDVTDDGIQELIDDGLLRHNTDHPHRLYTVTPDGRDTIGESYRQGIDYGHGKGDLEESSPHILAVEIGRRYLIAHYRDNPDSPVVEVIPYYEIREGELPAAAFMAGPEEAEKASEDFEQHRLDCVGLDQNGDVVVALEAERVNHDVKRAVPEDYDKMAACNPEEAIWVVMKQADGHKILSALNNPPDGEPRVEKTYAKTTPPQQFRIDTPGLTAVYPAEWLHSQYPNNT